MTNIIAGVDASLTSTGVCVYDLSTTENPDYVTSLSKEGKSRGAARLIKIRDSVKKIFEEYAVTCVFMEDYSYGSKGNTFDIGELGGTLKVLYCELEIPYVLVPPKSLKKYITRNGNAKKNVMLEQTFRRYNVGSEVLKNDDMVDAYCLARFGQKYLDYIALSPSDNSNIVTKEEAKVLEKVIKCNE